MLQTTSTIVLFLHYILPAYSFTIPVQSNATLNALQDRCNSFPDWIGNGINQEDCRIAIKELKTDDVQPRKGQEYEFYTHGAPRMEFPLPLVITPRTHEFRESSRQAK